MTTAPSNRALVQENSGAIVVFGSLAAGWKPALERYVNERDDIFDGRTPTARNKDGLRLLELLNRFLHFKRGLVVTGELPCTVGTTTT